LTPTGTIRAPVGMRLEGGMIYGLSAVLFGEITVRNGSVEQGNFDTYPVVRLKDAPKTEVHLAVTGGKKWGGIGETGAAVIPAARDQRDLRGDRQAHSQFADQEPELSGEYRREFPPVTRPSD
jgi:hypothetical protein